MDVFDIFSLRVLENDKLAFVGVHDEISTYVEDLKDPGFTDNCTADMSTRSAMIKRRVLTIQCHCLRSAFFHRGRYFAKNGTRSLPRFVPSRT